MKLQKNHLSFVDILMSRAELTPDSVAFRFLKNGEVESETLTYYELDNLARRIAVRLQTLCEAENERVLLLLPPGLSYISAFFGCLYSGMLAVPVFPPKKRDQSQSRLRAIVSDCSPVVALTLGELDSDAKFALGSSHPSGQSALQWVDVGVLADTHDTYWRQPDIHANRLAFLQYTSGSTSDPKGVMVSHENLIHNSDAIYRAFRIDEESRMVSWLPAFHDMGLIATMLQPVYGGYEAVLMSSAVFLKKPIRWLKAISNFRGTISVAPNFAYELCVRHVKDQEMKELDLSSWKIAANGAEPIKERTMRRFAERFAVCGFPADAFASAYGMAEATLLVASSDTSKNHKTVHVDKLSLQNGKVKSVNKEAPNTVVLVSSGTSLPDQHLSIVNPESQAVCGEGEVGEIWVSGPSIAKGYWNNESSTKETFQAKTDSQQGNYLRTGDLGFMISKELYVTGRLKDLIIVRGGNHYPQDIESSVDCCHPALSHNCCAVFSASDDSDDQLVVVQEVKRSYLRNADVDEIFEAIIQAVSVEHELQVSGIALIKPGNLPRTTSGKVRRRYCRQQYLSGELNLLADWPDASQEESREGWRLAREDGLNTKSQIHVDEMIAWLITKVADVLGRPAEEIGVDLPLSHLGLDSASALIMAGEIEGRFQKEVPDSILFDYPTINALAHYLTDTDERAPSLHIDLSKIEALTDSQADQILNGYSKSRL